VPWSPTVPLINNRTATLTQLFKKLRPDTTPNDIFIAVSEPSVCNNQYCACKDQDCRLDKYKITIFMSRREQGRRVTKPWIRVYSTEGFSDVVERLMVQANELITRTEEGLSSQAKAIGDSDTCSVEILYEDGESILP